MILVTGTKGFIGSFVTSYLQIKGYDTVGIDTDIRNKDALTPHFTHAEFVIHAAAKVKKEIPNTKEYYAINVLGTRNVCLCCLEHGSKLIHLSSIADGIEGTESVRLYGESKQASQQLVEQYSHLYGLKAVILRLGVIYNLLNNSRRPGARYPIEKLAEDIETLITSHDFSSFTINDYSGIRVS